MIIHKEERWTVDAEILWWISFKFRQKLRLNFECCMGGVAGVWCKTMKMVYWICTHDSFFIHLLLFVFFVRYFNLKFYLNIWDMNIECFMCTWMHGNLLLFDNSLCIAEIHTSKRIHTIFIWPLIFGEIWWIVHFEWGGGMFLSLNFVQDAIGR